MFFEFCNTVFGSFAARFLQFLASNVIYRVCTSRALVTRGDYLFLFLGGRHSLRSSVLATCNAPHNGLLLHLLPQQAAVCIRDSASKSWLSRNWRCIWYRSRKKRLQRAATVVSCVVIVAVLIDQFAV